MKALSMPISSPSRAEKFPPPLMRFLRSNTGCRSRGRSRSSPIFYKRNGARVIEITHEPSSPKVTCIGQVKSAARKPGDAAVNRRRCWLVKKALFLGKLSSRFYSQKRGFRRFFCKWALFFRFGYCKRVDIEENSFKKSEKIEFCSKKDEIFEGGTQESVTNFNDDCSTPPRNALILTRCKSAPYKASSLGARFWSSPLGENGENSEELQKYSCEKDEEDSRIDQESAEEFENLVDNGEALKGILSGGVHPLLLTRCKSEPARIGERPNQEANFLRQRRLD